MAQNVSKATKLDVNTPTHICPRVLYFDQRVDSFFYYPEVVIILRQCIDSV